MEYEVVIGLEVHLQMDTKTKTFCGCATTFGQRPNSQVCPVCLGFPGSLPVLNEKAFLLAIKTAIALNASINDAMKFDRKNYFYPDLPKDYQISQFDKPLANNGYIDINSEGKIKRICIRRVHLEEDAGKLLHESLLDSSLVDFNRCGMPLIEIVTEPDISSPEEAYEYLVNLKSILKYIEVSDCDMEKGSLRCDANVSIRIKGAKELGTKTEVKNMNSFKNVKLALEYEIKRQIELLEKNTRIVQETRLFDKEKLITVSMRSKEESHDYRYFPEPDLVPFNIEKSVVEKIKLEIPELPEKRFNRIKKDFGLNDYDAGIIVQEKKIADFFEELTAIYKKPKIAANWVTQGLAAYLNEKNLSVAEIKITPKHLAKLLFMIDDNIISGKIAKEILFEMLDTGIAAEEIVKSKNLTQISDKGKLSDIAAKVIAENKKSVADFKSGKENAFIFLVGQVMKETRGKANPAIVNEILRELLKEETSNKKPETNNQ